MFQNEIWNSHNDLFDADDPNLLHIAARVMGREMSKIGKRNEKLFKRLASILNTNTRDFADSRMAQIMVEYFRNSVEENIFLIRQLELGFTEQRNNH